MLAVGVAAVAFAIALLSQSQVANHSQAGSLMSLLLVVVVVVVVVVVASL